jgi:hypothetical protein
MFTAYFDASGSFHDQPVLAVAGFVASADGWIDWESAWLKRLKEDGLEYFHRNELSAWHPNRRKTLIDDLSAIILDHVSCKTGIAVVNEGLHTHLTDAERKQWRINAYSLAGRIAAKEMRAWSSSWGGRMPEMVFERGDDGSNDLKALMEGDGYASPIFKPKKTSINRKSGISEEGAIPLKAEDLLAYEVYSRGQTVEVDVHIKRAFMRLPDSLDRVSGACGVVGDNQLEFLRQGLDQRDSLIAIHSDVKIKL